VCSLQCQSNSGHSASSLQNVGADLQRPFLPAKHNAAEATQNGNDDQHPHKQKATSCKTTLQTGLRHVSSPLLHEAPTHARLANFVMRPRQRQTQRQARITAPCCDQRAADHKSQFSTPTAAHWFFQTTFQTNEFRMPKFGQ
jgi:hypothetical protein